jgi:hypothetical protein
MAQISVWRVRFHLEATVGKGVTSGPYTSFAGISGGSRGDVHSAGVTSSLVTAITNNLSSIMSAQGAGSGGAGTVVIDSYDHASVPDVWT